MKTVLPPLLITALLIWLTACTSEQPGIAAPLNDRTTLEKLAKSYENVSESVPVSPVKLAPGARHKFVEQVFREAGFGYSATLIELSRIEPGEITQLHKDMKDLLLLPHYGVNFKETKQIYTQPELTAIEQINKNFAAAEHSH